MVQGKLPPGKLHVRKSSPILTQTLTPQGGICWVAIFPGAIFRGQFSGHDLE